MATGPKLPATPYELFDNLKDPREQPLLSKYWLPGTCGLLGFVGTICTNWLTKRPVFSGIQRHALVTAGAVAAGLVIDKYREQYLAERDAMIRHYILLHPEDFPPFEQKKYADVLEPWIPIR